MTVREAKAQARALKAALSLEGVSIQHAQALEMIAQRHGARDWNTLCAQLTTKAAQGTINKELAEGDRVCGTYLGQPFSGRITHLSGGPATRRIGIRFDQTLDVVRFESFSNLRSQITATINAEGCSFDRTSDGQAQLVVRREA
ncbi:MAG: glyoxalase superfamily protein [Asticcacaulis sp.]